MLTNAIRQSSLFTAWKADQKIAFGLTLVLSGRFAAPTFRAASTLLRDTPLEILGDSALHQCACLETAHEKALGLQWEGDARLGLRANLALEQLRTMYNVNHQLLAARALTLLLRSQLNLERFLHWAERLSPVGDDTAQHVWTAHLWTQLRELVDGRPELRAKLEATMADFKHTDGGTRMHAVCEWYEALHSVYDGEVPPILTRLGFGLLNAQFCWPIQIAETNEGAIGLVLPFVAWLRPGKRGDSAASVLVRSGGLRYLQGDGENPHGFEGSSLKWDHKWHEAMRVGLGVGKFLWRSQTGRMEDRRLRVATLRSALFVDFSVATEIVDSALQSTTTSLRLEDRSAEAYWTQAVLGLLLPAHRVPLSTATGTILNRGAEEFALGPVEGLEAKLSYASRTGFLQRMVLPRTPQTRKCLEAAEKDLAMREDLLESNFCSSARDAADVMQASGWRRAIFLSTPEARAAFSHLSRDLFEVDASGVPMRGAVSGVIPDVVRQARARAAEALDGIQGLTPCGDEAIAFIDRQLIDETRLGHWLAHADHRVRTADEEGFAGPGLGIACIRTFSAETSMRFWAHLLDVLQASDELREKFQFGTIDQARDALSRLLNNFRTDAAISGMPAPDLLVILDDAGWMQDSGPVLARADYGRRGLHRFFGRQDSSDDEVSLFVNSLEPRDDQRRRVLGATRVLIVRPPEAPRAPDYRRVASSISRDLRPLALDALRIFRSGFSVHSARAVIATACAIVGRAVPDWAELKDVLDKLVHSDKKISYGRGQYFFTAAQAASFRPDARLVLNADMHEAVALSFAPIIASSQRAGARRLSMAAHELREATWHFHQAYAYASSRAREDRVRGHLALLGFVLPVQDWDTVRALAYDRARYGTESFDLACRLIAREAEEGSPADPGCFASAIEAASEAMKVRDKRKAGESKREARIRQSDRAVELLSWVRKFVDFNAARVDVSDSGRIRLYSQQAFYIQRFMETARKIGWPVEPAVRDRCAEDVKSLRREHLWPAVLSVYGADPDVPSYLHYPLAHRWLGDEFEALCSNAAWALDAWRCAYATCATDVNPTGESWLNVLASFPSECGRREWRRLLALWNARILDKTAFGARLTATMQRLTEAPDSNLAKDVYQLKSERVDLVRRRLRAAARISDGWCNAKFLTHSERLVARQIASAVSDAYAAVFVPSPSTAAAARGLNRRRSAPRAGIGAPPDAKSAVRYGGVPGGRH